MSVADFCGGSCRRALRPWLMAGGDAEADGRRCEIEGSSHHVFIAIGAEDAGGSARGEITVAAGRVNLPEPLDRMLAGLTINSNHRGDGGVRGACPLFPPGRMRSGSRRKGSGVEGGGAEWGMGGRFAQTKMDKLPPYITGWYGCDTRRSFLSARARKCHCYWLPWNGAVWTVC